MKNIFFILSIAISSLGVCQDLSKDEMDLYNKMNSYRASKGLTKLPLSNKLCEVAKLHVENLQSNKRKIGKYSGHSWFSDKRWRKDVFKKGEQGTVETKPKEITGYTKEAYEVFFMSIGKDAVPEEALTWWKHSSGHNNTILNKGDFDGLQWKNCGVAMIAGIAVIWFGDGE